MRGPSGWQTERRAEVAPSNRYLGDAGIRSEHHSDNDIVEVSQPNRNSVHQFETAGTKGGKIKNPRNNDGEDSDEDETPGAYAVTRVTETGHPVDDGWDPTATDQSLYSSTFADEPQWNDPLDIQENMDIPRVSCDVPELPSKTSRHSRRCLLLTLAVLVSMCAFGGIVAFLLLSRKGGSSSLPSAGADSDADADCQSLHDAFHQCECLGRMDVTDANVRDQYNVLLASEELVQFVVGLDTSIESCTPENMALVWLATEMAADEEAGQTVIDSQIQDRLVLANAFETLGGRGWTENTNWMSSASVCDWFGITCDLDEQIVTLSLPKNQLQGTLDSRLALLYDLKSLELSDNEITGSIPLDVWNLPSLGKTKKRRRACGEPCMLAIFLIYFLMQRICLYVGTSAMASYRRVSSTPRH